MLFLFKILKGNASVHGDGEIWPLPRQVGEDAWDPGEWISSPLLDRRLTLVRDIYSEMRWGYAAYEVEWEGKLSESKAKGTVSVKRARLVRPARHDEWWLAGCAAVEEIHTLVRDFPLLRPQRDPDPAWIHSTAPTWPEAWKLAHQRVPPTSEYALEIKPEQKRAIWRRYPAPVLVELPTRMAQDSLLQAGTDYVADHCHSHVMALGLDRRHNAYSDLIFHDLQSLASCLVLGGCFMHVIPELKTHQVTIEKYLDVWRAGFGLHGTRSDVYYTYSGMNF
jgi:hypothetical protein